MGFYQRKNTEFFNPYKSPVLTSAGRPDRSTELGVGRVGRPVRSTDMHRHARQSGWRAGRPTPVDHRELLLSGKPWSTGTVDRQRALLSVPGHSHRAGRPRLQRSEIWPLAVDRAGQPL